MRLELHNINKSFGQNHVLKDIGFTAQSGSAFGLLGRNGSGKTTTMRIIMDIFPQDSGTVKLDGRNVKEFLSKIGYLPEERGLYPKRIILDQMIYLAELRGVKPQTAKKRAESLLEKLEASEYLKKRLDTLSKGNQQKIQLAIALINDPEILILDEPFSGLDPVNAQVLKSLVSEMVKAGKMVIFSSHQMANVEEFCDDICIINQGRIVLEGALRKIKKAYPRNKILIRPENEDYAGLAKQLSEVPSLKTVVEKISDGKQGCVVTLRRENDRKDLFEYLSQNDVSIDAFQVLEPTLEEIFVEKAGYKDESI